mmetsp:Transcript_7052/g.11642  ORF Transcript_7052/g.11642 Transcript_7052/m.11642 type:complete len:84 (-) Transcript_7052:14-265(-)
MGLGNYSYLFEQNNALEFWMHVAEECGVSIVFDAEKKEILMIGLQANVKQYQQQMLRIIKEIKSEEIGKELIDKEYLQKYAAV